VMKERFKKVLMIAYGFPPIAYAGTHRTLRFCRYLPDNGWMPTVVTIRENADLHNDFNLLKRIPREIRISRTRTVDVWHRVWKRSLSPADGRNGNGGGKPGLLETLGRLFRSMLLNLFSIPDHMLLWVPFAVIRGLALDRKEDFDVIYTTSPPHSEHLAGLLLAKICRKAWVADFRDPILDNFCMQDLPAYRRIVNKLLERVIVRNADRVILVSDLYCQAIAGRYPACRHKFTVIRNGFDPEQFKRIEPCLYTRFTILYTGSFYGTIMPDFFLRGLKMWVESKGPGVRGDVQALFYGFGSRRVETLARELGLEDVVKVFGFIPQDEVIRKQKGADLLLFIIGFDEQSRGVISSKVFEYLAAGVPILALIPEGDALKVISTHAQYYHVIEHDYPGLMKALDAAYEGYLGKSARPAEPESRHLDSSPFSARLQVKDLARIFDEMNRLN